MNKALLTFCLLFVSSCFAIDDNSLALGWYWGKNKPVEQRNKEKPKMQNDTPVMSKSNSDILKDINLEVEEKKATAILEPTIKNITDYVAAQNKVVNLASGFTQMWSKAMLYSPELNYIAKHPTDNYTQQIIREDKYKAIKASINIFSQTHGFLFFFEGNNTISTFQSKIVSNLAAKYGISIIPVSLNGIPNHYFNRNITDKNKAQMLGVKVAPSLMAMDIRAKKITPLAVGVISEFELEEKIDNFVRQGRSDG
jgi:conjugal transfer pilus assembly protein TraF